MRALALLLVPLILSGCATPSGSQPPTGAHEASHVDGEKLFPDVHGLAYDAMTQTLWAATHAGLQRRVGEGPWEPIGPQQDLMGFSPDPVRRDVFYASGHPAGGGNLGAIVSTDGGATWSPVGAPGADFHAMIATPDALYGSFRGAVHRSADRGATWEQVSLLGVAAFAYADGALYASTTKDVRASDDRGVTWRVLDDVPAFGLAAATEDVLYAGVKGGVQKSVDGGRTWAATSLSPGERPVGHVNVAKGDTDVVHAASYDGLVWRSDDAGATWNAVERS